MNVRKNRRRVAHIFYGRFYGRYLWISSEESAWLNIAPVGREFGSPDYERLMEEDFKQQRLSLAKLVDLCKLASIKQPILSDPDFCDDIANVQLALHELGHIVESNVAYQVWKQLSSSLMAGWIVGAQSVDSARKTLLSYSHLHSSGTKSGVWSVEYPT